MPEVGIRELKARTSEILREVREQRVSYVVTHRGHPTGLLIPVPDNETPDVSISQQNADDPWDRLMQLGEEISEGWEAGSTTAEILSEMRR